MRPEDGAACGFPDGKHRPGYCGRQPEEPDEKNGGACHENEAQKPCQPDNGAQKGRGICRTASDWINQGRGPAVGVTHTAVMMAGYLTGICRRRCAVLEWNGSGTFDRLEESCLGKRNGGQSRSFSCPGRGLLQKCGDRDPGIVQKTPLSGGNCGLRAAFRGNQEEFFRCDRQFLLAGLKWSGRQGRFWIPPDHGREPVQAGRLSPCLEARRPERIWKRSSDFQSGGFRFQ